MKKMVTLKNISLVIYLSVYRGGVRAHVLNVAAVFDSHPFCSQMPPYAFVCVVFSLQQGYETTLLASGDNSKVMWEQGNNANTASQMENNSAHVFQTNRKSMNRFIVKRSIGLENHLFTGQASLNSNEVNTAEMKAMATSNNTNLENNNTNWLEIFNLTQLVMVVLGFVANSVTVITLMKNGQSFSFAILILLRHQSFVDAMTCVAGAISLAMPHMWLPGVYFLDAVVCHFWHSQLGYWFFVCVSIWNLVAISFERYLAVCHPFKHADLTRKKTHIILGICYLSSIFTMIGVGLQVRMQGDICVTEYFIRGKAGKIFYFGFSIYGFLYCYLIPTILFCVFYGLVILTFRRRQNEETLSNSRVIDKATKELTKTAIVVTCIFIVAIGYDLWYYLLGYTGLVEFEMNSPIQKVGVWLSAFNSVANPFVYALLMPAYRKSVQTTFFKLCTGSTDTAESFK